MASFTDTDRLRFYQILSEHLGYGRDGLSSTTLNSYNSDEAGYEKRLQFYAGLTHPCFTGSGWAYCTQNPLQLMINDTIDPLTIYVDNFDGWANAYTGLVEVINQKLAERGWSHRLEVKDNLQSTTLSTTETMRSYRAQPQYMYCWSGYWFVNVVIRGTEAA
ncbi:hypothetical protein pEaSNUABM29_00065 [Erwinia phage pEa_SNUABM_29]|nr:hypothetical protein pEaSNUABM29_00065 [Erwinia phage pEa_SNUABM_29]